MKKITTIIGILFAALLLITALFIKMQLPGRFIFTTLSLLIGTPFAIFFFIWHFLQKKNLPFLIVGILISNVLTMAILFKLNHYPGSDMLLGTSLIGGVIGFLVVFFAGKAYRDKSKRIPLNYILALISGLAIIYLASSVSTTMKYRNNYFKLTCDAYEMAHLSDTSVNFLTQAYGPDWFGDDTMRYEAVVKISEAQKELNAEIDAVISEYLALADFRLPLPDDDRSALKYISDDYITGSSEFFLGGSRGECKAMIIQGRIQEYNALLSKYLNELVPKESRGYPLYCNIRLLDVESPYLYPDDSELSWEFALFEGTPKFGVLASLYNLKGRINSAAAITVQSIANQKGQGLALPTVEVGDLQSN